MVFEAALVAPLLVVIMLGIAETAMLMKDNVALSSLVRQGGRAATASPASSGDDSPELTDVTAAVIARAETALSKGSVSELWVYKADAAGFPAGNPDGDHFGRCDTDCVAYRWDADQQTFDYAGGHWNADEIDVCSDDLGVYMRATHDFLTGVLSHGIDISKHETFRFASPDCGSVTS